MTVRLLMDLLSESADRGVCSVAVVTLSDEYVASLRRKRESIRHLRVSDPDVTTLICSDSSTIYYDAVNGQSADFTGDVSRYRVLGSGVEISGYPAGSSGEVFVSDDGVQWMADRVEGRWPRESEFISWAELEAILEDANGS